VKKERGRKRLVTSLREIQIRNNVCCSSIDRKLISEERTLLWLSRRDLKGKTGSEIIAVHDRALQIKCHAIKISKTKTGIKLYQDYDEKIDHIRTACPVLAKEQYISSDMIVCVLKYKHIKKVRKPYCAMNKRKLTETSMTIKHTYYYYYYYYYLFIFSGSVAQRGLWPPRSLGFLITNNDAPRSVGLLWTSDQLVAETST
jgi:hypothetical protein